MRTRNLFLALVLVLFMAGMSYSASLVTNLGIPDSSGIGVLQIDSDRVLTIPANAGLIVPYELATTSDTITAAETGKTFILNPTSQSTFILPDANVGMSFKFVAANGSASKKFILNPQDTDYFRGVINSAAASTFAVGDSVTSPGNTGDSLTIFCGQDLYWDVVDRTGTWTDSN